MDKKNNETSVLRCWKRADAPELLNVGVNVNALPKSPKDIGHFLFYVAEVVCAAVADHDGLDIEEVKQQCLEGILEASNAPNQTRLTEEEAAEALGGYLQTDVPEA